MNPCREFWGDIVSEKEKLWALKKRKKQDESYFTTGNSLLANMGKSGRDFFSSLYSIDCVQEFNIEDEPDNSGGNLLDKIKDDIFSLTEPYSVNNEKTLINPDDSITINSSHGARREIEILHDQLLKWFEEDSSLKPKDILVMTPDINKYSPYIDAVFQTATEKHYIPYTIADRAYRVESGVISAFVEILNITNSRFEVSTVFSIFEREIVREKFGVSEDECGEIKEIVKSCGIKWGIDSAHKESMNLPGFYESTWEHGLDRLILGFAMEGGEHFFDNILPFETLGASASDSLGKFIFFIKGLFSLVNEKKSSKTLNKWSERLLELVEIFFDEKKTDDISSLKKMIQELNSISQSLNPEKGKKRKKSDESELVVDFEVVRSYITNIAENSGKGAGFIKGGVTFSSMIPLRSIPFSVIALVGMNDELYPRKIFSPGFDLIKNHPRSGDRNLREGDRYLFLETLLSAGKKLYISYTGRSAKDNSMLIPSILVMELIDYIDKNYSKPDGGKLSEDIIKEHPLHSFSRRYFMQKDSRFFTYHAENMPENEVSQVKKSYLDFRAEPVKKEDETISPESFFRFFRNPAEYFFKNRLNIFLSKLEEEEEDKELFTLSALELYILKGELTKKLLDNISHEDSYKIALARGIVPEGITGRDIFEEVMNNSLPLAGSAAEWMEGFAEEKIFTEQRVGKTLIAGFVGNIYGSRQILWRPGKIRAIDKINLYINHLLINLSGLRVQSIFTSPEEEFRLVPFDDCAGRLEVLVNVFDEGSKRILPFFPKTSWDYAATIFSGKSKFDALKKGKNTWKTNFGFKGESEDNPYFELISDEINFDTSEAPTKDFEKIALTIFEPIVS